MYEPANVGEMESQAVKNQYPRTLKVE